VSDDLSTLGEAQTVEQPKSRLLLLVGALVLVGVLFAALVVLVVAFLSSAKTDSSTTLAQVATDTAILFPAGSTLTTADYDRSDEQIVLDAEVQLPDGSADPFAGTAYIESGNATQDWPADLVDPVYYVASGEEGTLNAEAVFATDGEGHPVVLVHLVQELG
jgi:hypothetical protein